MGKFGWEAIKWTLSALAAAALIELCHIAGFSPDRWLAEQVMTSATETTFRIAFWGLLFAITAGLLFVEHWATPKIISHTQGLRVRSLDVWRRQRLVITLMAIVILQTAAAVYLYARLSYISQNIDSLVHISKAINGVSNRTSALEHSVALLQSSMTPTNDLSKNIARMMLLEAAVRELTGGDIQGTGGLIGTYKRAMREIASSYHKYIAADPIDFWHGVSFEQGVANEALGSIKDIVSRDFKYKPTFGIDKSKTDTNAPVSDEGGISDYESLRYKYRLFVYERAANEAEIQKILQAAGRELSDLRKAIFKEASVH